MSDPHPECAGRDPGFEPTVGEQLRLAEFVTQLERIGEEELRALCRQLATLVLVTHPAAMRWLAREAARNLSGQVWTEEHSRKLMAGWLGRDPEVEQVTG